MNHNYFSEIDTEDKAYWLGFLYADGCVLRKRDIIQIQLQALDKKHLEKWHKSIRRDKEVGEFSKLRNDIKFDYVYSSISSKQFKLDLTKHGCIPNKSGKLVFPNLNENLKHHFLRGFFDGDGSFFRVWKNARYQPCVKYVANLEFLWSIKDFIKCNGLPRKCTAKCKIVGQLAIEGNNEAKRIIDIMYKDATIWLDRKKKAIEDHFSDPNIPRPHGKRLLAFGEEKTLSEWSKDKRCKVSFSCLQSRYIRQKWDLERALTQDVDKTKWKKSGF